MGKILNAHTNTYHKFKTIYRNLHDEYRSVGLKGGAWF